MQGIRVTVTVEIETNGADVSVHRQTLNNVMSGGNPIYFARDVEQGLAVAAGVVTRAVAEQYGDVRAQETNRPGPRTAGATRRGLPEPNGCANPEQEGRTE